MLVLGNGVSLSYTEFAAKGQLIEISRCLGLASKNEFECTNAAPL
jgi:hypothetical protein